MIKTGTLVKIVGSHAQIYGTIIGPWKVSEWWEVLTQRGQVIHWPESQMEAIDEV